MKKVLCFALTFLLLSVPNGLPEWVSANNIRFGAVADILSKVEGEGFHDEAGLAFNDIRVSQSDCLVLHPGDWGCYNIATLPAGTYNIMVYTANSAATALSFRVNGKTGLPNVVVAATGSYATFAERNLGQLYLKEGSTTLVVCNTGTASVYLNYFELAFVSPNNLFPSTMKIEMENVIPGGQNVAFHDDGTRIDHKDVLEKVPGGTGTIVCLRSGGEWAKYDVSLFPAGTYKIIFSTANTFVPTFSASVDDVVQLSAKPIPATGSYSNFVEYKMGYITFSGEQQTLKILNDSANACFLDCFILQKLSDIHYTAFDGNLGSIGSTVPRGSDSFIVTFNNALAADSISTDNVILKDKDGIKAGYSVSLDGTKKQIKITLNRTLDFEKEYEILIQNIKDEDGQSLKQPISIALAIDGRQNTAGNASVSVDSFEKNYNRIKIMGTMVSGANVGISGRNVVLTAKMPAGNTVEWVSGVSLDNGRFVLEYIIPETEDSGKYNLTVGGEYVSESADWEKDIYFYNSALDTQISSEMSNLETAQQVAAVLGKYLLLIGVDLETPQSKINIFDYVYSGLSNKQFDSVEMIIGALNSAITLEYINQATSAGDIMSVLENQEYCNYLSIDKAKWDLMVEGNKTLICEEILADERYADKTVFGASLDIKINNKLKIQLSIDNPAISANAPTIGIGQVADVNFKFNTAQSNFAGIHLELSYDDRSAIIYERDAAISFTSGLQNVTATSSRGNHKILIELLTATAVNNAENICTLSFSAPKGSAGSYPLSVSGYTLYHPSIIGGYTVRADLIINSNPVITVTQSSDGRSYGGGGGSGGGNSYGTVAIPPPKKENSDTENETQVIEFTDLEDVQWAWESISELARRKIVTGKENGKFAPNDYVTRSEFCKMMVLAFQLTADNAEPALNDVEKEAWYYRYIADAVKGKLMSGDAEGNFHPNEQLTREDMSVIAYRLATVKGKVMTTETIDVFNDTADISDYAKEQVYIMRKLGVINGMEENRFAPKDFVTRAMAAKVIYKLMEVLK